MVAGDPPTERHSFQTHVDLPAVLDRLGIEYLDVHEKRLIVIYNTAIINIDVADGGLAGAQKIVIELWEPPTPGRADVNNPEVTLRQFIDEIVSTTGTNTQ